MRCEKFEELWNEYLDRRISPQNDEILNAHAAICPKCAELLAGGELLQWAFPGSPQLVPSATFSDRVVAALAENATHATTLLFNTAVAETETPHTHAPIPMAFEVLAQPNSDVFNTHHEKKSRWKLPQWKQTQWKWSAGIGAAVALVLIVWHQSTAPHNNLVQTQPTTAVVNTVPNSTQTNRAIPATQNPANPANTTGSFSGSSNLAVGTVIRRDQISQVGFTVADGITPVTKSVSAALQSLKKPITKEDRSEPTQPMKSGSSSWVFELNDFYT